MQYLAFFIQFFFLNVTIAGDKLYKCVEPGGKIEYSNVDCKGKPQVFNPAKGKGVVTSVKMPKIEAAPAATGTKPIMTAVQMKPLVIPESWLK
jgi:hypothetical protein